MRVLLGILFILGAVAFLIFSIVPAMMDSDFVLGVLEPIYCESGDHLSAEQIVSYDNDGTGYSADYTCMRPNETTYNVSGKAFVITAVGFVIPLLLGIGLINLAARGMTNRWQTNMANDMTQQVYSQWVSNMPDNVRQAYQDSMSNPNAVSDPTQKLKQLQAAYEQNLITRDEYERKRAEIMQQF